MALFTALRGQMRGTELDRAQDYINVLEGLVGFLAHQLTQGESPLVLHTDDVLAFTQNLKARGLQVFIEGDRGLHQVRVGAS